jgi:hypothetical protein
MGTMRRHISSQGEWQFDRATKRLGGWLAGYGLLSLNIGLFLLVATGLFLYNLYDDPRNIDVLERLRLWALLIIFHAVAVTVFWIMSWAVRADRSEPTRSLRPDAPTPGIIPAIGSGETYSRPRFSPTVSTPVLVDETEETEHFWRRRSTSILHRHEPGRQDTWAWSTTDEAELTRTWPERSPSEEPPTKPDLEAASQFFDGGTGTIGDHVVGVVYDPSELEHDDDEVEQAAPEDHVIDPLRLASRQHEPDSPAGGDAALTRWLWVEAAAAAWLAQREDAGIEGADSHVPPSSDGYSPEAAK